MGARGGSAMCFLWLQPFSPWLEPHSRVGHRKVRAAKAPAARGEERGDGGEVQPGSARAACGREL